MKSLLKLVNLCCFVLFACTVACPSAWAEREISIYVPPFEGPAGLSRSVNTILRLQIWQTLRKSTGDGGIMASFGTGTVKWGPDHLPDLTYPAAETVAHHGRILSQLVLWGAVQKYGDGAVVQAFLSIPWYPRLNDRYYEDFRTQRNEVLVVRIPVGEKIVVFQQDVPRRRVAFEPIVLTQHVIAHYSALDAIVMYNPTNPSQPIGTVGDIIDAVEQYREKSLVKSRGITGIVYLPELSKHRSEIVDFASGLIRIFRSDWKGSRALFARVTETSHAPTDIRIDAYLYRAMANANLGLSGAEDIEQARALNPYALRTVQFLIMDKLAELSRAIDAGVPLDKRREIIDVIQQQVAKHEHLFLRHDPWLEQLKAKLALITYPQ